MKSFLNQPKMIAAFSFLALVLFPRSASATGDTFSLLGSADLTVYAPIAGSGTKMGFAKAIAGNATGAPCTTNSDWTVTGEPSAAFTVALPADAEASMTDGTYTVTLSSFAFVTGNGSRSFDVSGNAAFSVCASHDAVPTGSSGTTLTGSYTAVFNY